VQDVVDGVKDGKLSDPLRERLETVRPEPLPHRPSTPPLTDLRLRAQLVSSSPVLLFMKGTPDAPRCGFSQAAVGLLRETGVTFDSFDILARPLPPSLPSLLPANRRLTAAVVCVCAGGCLGARGPESALGMADVSSTLR